MSEGVESKPLRQEDNSPGFSPSVGTEECQFVK